MAVIARDDELGMAGPGGMFIRTVSWDAAQSALCSNASLWWEAARANQNRCSVCRLPVLRPCLSHVRGSWLTAFAAPVWTHAALSRSSCRRSWSMASASTVLTHSLCVPYCREREAGGPALSGTVPGMATVHVPVRFATKASWVACLQGPPPDASEYVSPQASGIQ